MSYVARMTSHMQLENPVHSVYMCVGHGVRTRLCMLAQVLITLLIYDTDLSRFYARSRVYIAA